MSCQLCEIWNSSDYTDCQWADPSREEEGQTKMRAQILNMIKEVNSYLKCCRKMEELYCRFGVVYHKTRQDVRNDEQLKRYHEVNEGDGFTDLDPAIQDLTKLLITLTHISPRVSAHELYHIMDNELVPAFRAAYLKCKDCQTTIKQLVSKSCQMYQDQLRTYHDWFDRKFDEDTQEFTLDFVAPEWAIFRKT
ncbi:hypothetical protein Ptr902_00241 [Pyrenophora tritici-repentis]|nr:hypothetical protein Ptr902_00241 [Pyrenophora tritici-repentis]